MIESALDDLTGKIFTFLTLKPKPSKCLLVKRHTENLKAHGDLSFVNTVKPWKLYLKSSKTEEQTLMKHLKKEHEDLVRESKNWKLPIAEAVEVKDRINLFLKRPIAIRIGLLQASSIHGAIMSLFELEGDKGSVQVDPECIQSDITTLRCRYIAKVLQNMCIFTSQSPEILVTTKSTQFEHKHLTCSTIIVTGSVINRRTSKKERDLSGEDCIEMRQKELTCLAMHKHGMRSEGGPHFKTFVQRLGESCVKFELLQVKPSSPINIDFNAPVCNKGSTFVLYNVARLVRLIMTYFETNYPELPEIEDIDFSLLNDEDEWTLIYNFVLGLPNLLNNCFYLDEKRFEFHPHHICSFLSSFVRIFSQYYRRVRILTEPRPHLMPVMHARIHMLLVFHDILNLCFHILDIKTVSYM